MLEHEKNRTSLILGQRKLVIKITMRTIRAQDALQNNNKITLTSEGAVCNKTLFQDY